MGCFDSVWFKCPGCLEKVEVQSKAGDCALRSYEPLNAPTEILTDIAGRPIDCDHCGKALTVAVHLVAIAARLEEKK